MSDSLPGLHLPATQTFDEWRDLGRKLCASARAVSWLIGDWLIAGSERYGEKARDEAQAIFRRDVDRLGPIVDTCRRFPEPVRHGALSFAHHVAVATVKDDGEAHRMLDRAESEHLTTAALRAAVKVKLSAQGDLPEWSDDTDEDQDYRGMVQAWNRATTIEARQAFREAIEEAGLEEIEL